MKSNELKAGDKILIGLLAAVGVVAVAYILFGWGAIGRFLNSQSTAAWVQAVGSIVAVWIAIWVPQRMRTIERAEQRERDRATAFVSFSALTDSMMLMRSLCDEIMQAIYERETKDVPIPIHRLHQLHLVTSLPSDLEISHVQLVNVSLAGLIANARGGLKTLGTALSAAMHMPDEEAQKLMLRQKSRALLAYNTLGFAYNELATYLSSYLLEKGELTPKGKHATHVAAAATKAATSNDAEKQAGGRT